MTPYARDVEGLVEAQFARHRAWLGAMGAAGIGPPLAAASGGPIRTSWNPVRLNGLGTVELRTMDGNHPEVVLAACSLTRAATDRVRREGLSVEPTEGARAFETDGRTLRVPPFAYLGGDLLVAAMTGGAGTREVRAYLDSILDFALPHAGERLHRLRHVRLRAGGYPTTEAGISEEYVPGEECIPEGEGLRLVLDACDELGRQVSRLRPRGDNERPAAAAGADAT